MNNENNKWDIKTNTCVFAWLEWKIDLIGDFEDVYMTGYEYRLEESPYPNKKCFFETKQKMTDAIERYKDINILFASYGYENYSGDAWVLYEQNGKLYEVNGSHCSCYGLENQWSPEEVTLPELEYRLINGSFGDDGYSGNDFKKELKKIFRNCINKIK